MATVCTFINAAAASTSAARSSPCSRRASVSSVRATAKSASSSTSAPARTVLGGVTLPRDVHRRRGAVVMRAEGEGIQRDDPKLDEKFATIGTGEHECQSCMYTYNPIKGDDFYPVSAGVSFKNLPEDWRCPTCGAERTKFKNMGKEVAGFEQNQGYGFANSMTGGEKSILIYGSLALFFAFFIAGYLLD